MQLEAFCSAAKRVLRAGLRGVGRGRVKRFVALILAAFLCTQASFAQDPSSVSWIPFSLYENLISVEARIDGKGPFRFMLDTGAAGNVVSPGLATKLGLTWTNDQNALGAGEASVPYGVTQAMSLKIGAIEFVRPLLYVVALPLGLSDPGGRAKPIEGILGYDLFEAAAVTVDYEHKRVRLESGDINRIDEAVAMPFQLSNHHVPVIHAIVDGIPGLFKIDSGDNGSLTLSRDFVEKNRLREKYRPHITVISGAAMGGVVRAEVTRVKRLTIGTMDVPDPITEFTLQRRGLLVSDTWSGTIGNGVLKHFTVTFDYARRKIWFKPNSTLRRRDPFNRAGMIVQIVHDGTAFAVLDVIRGSPASKVGVEKGDQIIAVDGIPAKQIDIDMIRRKVRQSAGTTLRIRLLRRGIVHDISFKLRDLV